MRKLFGTDCTFQARFFNIRPFNVVCCDQLTNSVAPEPEVSSPHSQQPASDPYPEPVESTPHTPTYLPKVNFDPNFPSMPWSSKWSFPSGFLLLTAALNGQNVDKNPIRIAHIYEIKFMTCPTAPEKHGLSIQRWFVRYAGKAGSMINITTRR
jgi:hypothetical protein